MLSLRDLFQWDRFVTPSIIKTFYWLAVAIVVLMALARIATGLQLMATNVALGMFTVLGAFLGTAVGVLALRVVAEFILIVFRINEHLGTIRDRGGM